MEIVVNWKHGKHFYSLNPHWSLLLCISSPINFHNSQRVTREHAFTLPPQWALLSLSVVTIERIMEETQNLSCLRGWKKVMEKRQTDEGEEELLL